MRKEKFERLVENSLISAEELTEIIKKSKVSSADIGSLLLAKGVPKHEVLLYLSEYYGCPFVEYDESISISGEILRRLDIKRLKKNLWFPVVVKKDRARVVAIRPYDPAVIKDVKEILQVEEIEFLVALPTDLIRIMEHNLDLNPHFPLWGGRTPLAKVRTYLANRRSWLSCYRTDLAKGRTGLAFIRTGLAFIAIARVLLKVFGTGWLAIIEFLLSACGLVMMYDGVLWYIPARKTGSKKLLCPSTQATWGTTLLKVLHPDTTPEFTRTGPIKGAKELRNDWANLSPVMRRRFLASDRTDMAEERTILACHRTVMARARTGLAFARTGIAVAGLGIGLMKQFHISFLGAFDFFLMIIGFAMAAEGFYWYFPGHRAGIEAYKAVREKGEKQSIWDFVFPFEFLRPKMKEMKSSFLLRKASAPGIWATTGLALERTVLADRRNVMSRLRTIMARSRTGLSFIRTGMVVTSVGIGLLIYLGIDNLIIAAINSFLVLVGLLLIADGLYWHVPAEKIRAQFPYCFGEMEINFPDYGKPANSWGRIIFSNKND